MQGEQVAFCLVFGVFFCGAYLFMGHLVVLCRKLEEMLGLAAMVCCEDDFRVWSGFAGRGQMAGKKFDQGAVQMFQIQDFCPHNAGIAGAKAAAPDIRVPDGDSILQAVFQDVYLRE